MKKYSLKLNLKLLSALSLCTLVHPLVLHAKVGVTHEQKNQLTIGVVHEQKNQLTISEQALTDAEVKFLADKIDQLSEWVQYSKKRFDQFFSKSNKESFGQHVEVMYQDIARFHNAFIIPVEKELAEHCPMTDAYDKVLHDALSVMKKFEVNLVMIHKLLNNPKYITRNGAGKQASKLAMNLAAELKKFDTASEKQQNMMLKQIETMQKELVQSNPILAQKITAITINLQKMSQNPPSPLTLLNGLVSRLRCASMPTIDHDKEA